MSFEEKLVQKAEKETKCRVSWKSHLDFYADTDGNIAENGAFVCQAEYTFYVSDGNFEASFLAPDVNFKDLATKKNALAFVHKEHPKLKYTSPVMLIFGDAVYVYEFDNNRKVFAKSKNNELGRLIDIAISKQKYSLNEYNKLHPTNIK